MNRPLTAVFAALEALLVVGIGVGLAVLPLSVLWAFHYDLQVEWVVFWRAAVDVWMLGHGVSLQLTLDPPLAAALALPGAELPFTVGLAPLGFALLTVLLGARAGRRIAETPHYLVGFAVASATFVLLTAGVAVSAQHAHAMPQLWQGILFPSAIFVVGMVTAGVVTLGRLGSRKPPLPPKLQAILTEAQERLFDVPLLVSSTVATALRGGAMIVSAVVAVAAVAVAVMLGLNYAQIIALYEAAQAGPVGGAALTVAQIGFVPNLVVWAAAWIVGPGFAVGAGSAVSPLGTQLGPIPGIPFLGALPTGDMPWGLLSVLVPVVVAFLVGYVMRGALVRDVGTQLDARWLVASGAGIGAVAAILLGVLAWWSGGAAGPGRLAVVGPNPGWVMLAVFVECGLAATIGLLVAARSGSGSRADTVSPIN